MASRSRSETMIKLGDNEFPMRPSFLAQDNIETDLGLGIFELLDQLSDMRNIRIRTVAIIIHHGIVGAIGERRAPSLEDIGEAVAEAKITELLEDVALFLQSCVMTEEQMKELEAETKEIQEEKGKLKA